MTAVIDEDVDEREAVERGDGGTTDPAGGKRILAAHFHGLDLEAMGLRYHADGGGFDLTTGPSDAGTLSLLLRRATAVFRRITSTVTSEVKAAGDDLRTLEQRAEERLHRWLMRKVRHLIRYALGRLAHLAARQLQKKAQQKKAARSGKRAGPSDSGQAKPSPKEKRRTAAGQRAAGPNGKNRPGPRGKGRPGPGVGKSGPGPHRDGTISPRTARKVVRELPEDQVRHLAEGLAPQEVDSVAEQLPVTHPEEAAPVLHEVEHAAKESVSSS